MSAEIENFYKLVCISCGKEWDEKKTVTNCLSCSGPLDVIYDYEYIMERLNVYTLRHSSLSALKYLVLYPILDLTNIVSLEEGGTPLHKCRKLGEDFGLQNLYLKNEGTNPTGVFKDRGSLVEITKAKELGAKAVCVASTGNMAASVAAYSSVANLPCYVVVPEDTPIGKLAQTISYGAKVLQIRGTYSDAVELTIQMAKEHKFHLAGDYAFRREGQKSQAYEIVEQLGYNVPDYVVVPMGCGTNISTL